MTQEEERQAQGSERAPLPPRWAVSPRSPPPPAAACGTIAACAQPPPAAAPLTRRGLRAAMNDCTRVRLPRRAPPRRSSARDATTAPCRQNRTPRGASGAGSAPERAAAPPGGTGGCGPPAARRLPLAAAVRARPAARSPAAFTARLAPIGRTRPPWRGRGVFACFWLAVEALSGCVCFGSCSGARPFQSRAGAGSNPCARFGFLPPLRTPLGGGARGHTPPCCLEPRPSSADWRACEPAWPFQPYQKKKIWAPICF